MRWLLPPVTGFPISQRYGEHKERYAKMGLPMGHEGLDFAANKGTPVHAAMDGTVTEVTRVPAVKRLFRKTQPPYGENVRVEAMVEGKRVTTIYAHLDHLADWVRKGAPVEQGDILGWTGNTGRVLKEPGYHLHFGVNIDDYPVDPADLIIDLGAK